MSTRGNIDDEEEAELEEKRNSIPVEKRCLRCSGRGVLREGGTIGVISLPCGRCKGTGYEPGKEVP